MTREELIKKESIETDEDVQDVLDYLHETNEPKYTTLKLVEELSELTEVLIKSVNKKPERKPSQKSIDEEVGDVLFRIFLYMRSKYPDAEWENIIEERVKEKANKFLGYIKENQYTGGI